MKKVFVIIISTIFIVLILIIFTLSGLRYFYPKKYSKTVKQYSNEYGLSENLVYAIIKCESGYKENAKSKAGALGLMQITPETFKWAAAKLRDSEPTESSLYSPVTNIKYGCYIYSLLLNEFGQHYTALAAYNAGRGKVLSWLSNKMYSEDGILLNNIPYSETDKYVKKVLKVKKIYDLIY